MELGEYGERFRENKIDGDLLVDLRCRRVNTGVHRP